MYKYNTPLVPARHDTPLPSEKTLTNNNSGPVTIPSEKILTNIMPPQKNCCGTMVPSLPELHKIAPARNNTGLNILN